MSRSAPLPLHIVWQGLLGGDPGPAIAFFDSLMDADLAYAAGGLLQDIAERIEDIGQFAEDQQQHEAFVMAAKQVINECAIDPDEFSAS